MSELPLTWIAQKIKIFNSYKSSTLNPLNYPDEVFELFSVPSFPTGRAEILSGKEIGSTKQLVQEGDVLLCKINPRINRVWTVTPSKGYRQIASSEWIVVRSDFHHSDFLKYFFREGSFRDLLCSDVSGVGGSLTRAKPSLVEHYLAMVAPQAEQTRIVEKLDEVLAQVDTIKARLDGIPAILKRFRQSVLAAAVSGRLTEEWRKTNPTTDISSLLVSIKNERDSLKKKGLLKKSFGKHEPVDGLNIELPESWIWTCFDEIAANDDNALKAGPFGSSLKKADCTDSGYRVYGQEQVIAGNEKLVSYYIDEIKFQQLKSCAIKPRDILISLVGTIGKVLILSEKVEAGIINPRLVKLSLNEEIERSFIKTYLDSPIAWQFFKGFSHGGTMDILNLGILKQLPIALPPVEEQKEIVRLVDQYFAFADTIEAQVKKAQARVDNLTQSILAKAFRGELVAQDLNDEPAEKLLERIAQARKEAEALAKAAKKVAKTK